MLDILGSNLGVETSALDPPPPQFGMYWGGTSNSTVTQSIFFPIYYLVVVPSLDTV